MRTVSTTEGQAFVLDNLFSDQEERLLSDSLLLTKFRRSDASSYRKYDTPIIAAEYDPDDFMTSSWWRRIENALQFLAGKRARMSVAQVRCVAAGFGDLVTTEPSVVSASTVAIRIFTNESWGFDDGASTLIYSWGEPTYVVHPKKYRVLAMGPGVTSRNTLPSRVSKQHLVTVDICAKVLERMG